MTKNNIEKMEIRKDGNFNRFTNIEMKINQLIDLTNERTKKRDKQIKELQKEIRYLKYHILFGKDVSDN